MADLIAYPNTEKRVVLIFDAALKSAPGTVKTFCFSDDETPISGLTYDPYGNISGVPRLSRSSRSVTGAAQDPAYTAVKLLRQDGEDISQDRSGITLDDLGRNWIIKNRPAQIYFGGESLPWSQYKIIFWGEMTGLDYSDDEYTIGLAGFETPAQLATIGNNVVTAAAWPNAGTNIGKTIPVCIGFCGGVTPLIVDLRPAPIFPTYLFHDQSQPYTSLQNVYEDGVVLATPGQYVDNLNGSFTLTYTPTGLITCDVIGIDSVALWATKITNLLKNYAGIPAAQIDAAAVAQANIDLPYFCGYLVKEKMTVAEVIERMSEGVQAWRNFQSDGIYRMALVTDPALGTPTKFITQNDILQASGGIKNEVCYNARCNYYENNTPISVDRLNPILTQTQKAVFSRLWYETGFSSPAIQTLYPNATSKRLQLRSFLAAHGLDAATKFVGLYGQERETARVTIASQDLTYDIGQIVQVTYEMVARGAATYRFGWNAKNFLVVGMAADFDKFEITLDLWG